MTIDFVFEIRNDPYANDIEKLFFSFQAFSDLHLGKKHCRARRVYHMGAYTMAENLRLIGDIVDLTYLRKHGMEKFGNTYHRQVLAQFFRKAGQGTNVLEALGNHEAPIRDKKTKYNGVKVAHRNMCGRTLYGIKFAREFEHEVVPGFVLKGEHGDAYDGSNGHYPEHITNLLGLMSDIDTTLQSVPGFEDFSIAQELKKKIKKMKKWSDIDRGIAAALDADPRYAAILTGHSHMVGHIARTPLGKYMINDDNCTEQVKFVSYDVNKTFALFEWHPHYMLVTEAGKDPVRVTWNQLGLPHFHKPAPLVEDEYTYRADRTIRVIKRMSPLPDRKKQVEAWRAKQVLCKVKGREYKGHTTAYIDAPQVLRPHQANTSTLSGAALAA